MVFAKIIGTSGYLPQKVLTNKDLESMVDTTHDWIVERTGIYKRHIITNGESTYSMALAAGKEALKNAGLKATDLDLIIVATVTPDKIMPCAACILQEKLGAKHIMAFDLSAACAGFVCALATAQQFIESGNVVNALVVGAEAMSTVLDWTDRNTCVLFGDGAGAVVLTANPDPGIHISKLQSDGNYGNILQVNSNLPGYKNDNASPYIQMAGREVFKFAVNNLGDLAFKTLATVNMKESDIDWLIPHQANIRIIQAIAKKLNYSMDKVIVTVDRHGNTSSASIPLALHEGISSGKIKSGQKLLLEAFGGGIIWGSIILTL